MPFAEKLAKLRKDKGFTQQELAQRAGIGIAQMRRYEKELIAHSGSHQKYLQNPCRYSR